MSIEVSVVLSSYLPARSFDAGEASPLDWLPSECEGGEASQCFGVVRLRTLVVGEEEIVNEKPSYRSRQ